jgi:anhydro-N-acetylmuramic acid kinase
MSDNIFPLYIGLMSGTSLDGVDGVLTTFSGVSDQSPQTLATAYRPFPASLRHQLLALQTPSDNEIHREALTGNALASLYAECIGELLAQSEAASVNIRAVGVHGQTIRHRPESGYTRQVNNPALLAELTGINVVSDFRSRDIAAGGQGAPLAPAFHQAVFGKPNESRVVANIGGIGNISVLDHGESVIGFDTGPGNVLMDAWIGRHQQRAYDDCGAWASTGTVIPALLHALLDEPFLTLPPPKSTGRDLFHMEWLDAKLAGAARATPADVQATLAAFTAVTLTDAITTHARSASAVYVCGGGAYNSHLMQLLQQRLNERGHSAPVQSTAALGVPPNHVEALAFAWLAHCHVERIPANLPSVTGAAGPRILGALYPA